MSRSSPSRDRQPRVATPWTHRAAEHGIRTVAFATIVAIALIFAFILKEAVPLLWEGDANATFGGLASLILPVRWDGYAEAAFVWQPGGEPEKLNVLPLFAGTLKVTLWALVFSLPVGIGGAIFVASYASPGWREVIKPTLELLASVPSVVLGFFALMVLATWVQALLGTELRLNTLVAALALSVTVTPVIFTISEDAIQSVPRSLVVGALALGARRWQTIVRIVLPAALPGISAGVLLGFGRAIGETMIVLMASGNSALTDLIDPRMSARTVTATIAAEVGEVAQGEPHWRVLFLLGAVLYVFTWVLNRLGTHIIVRLHERLSARGAP